MTPETLSRVVECMSWMRPFVEEVLECSGSVEQQEKAANFIVLLDELKAPQPAPVPVAPKPTSFIGWRFINLDSDGEPLSTHGGTITREDGENKWFRTRQGRTDWFAFDEEGYFIQPKKSDKKRLVPPDEFARLFPDFA